MNFEKMRDELARNFYEVSKSVDALFSVELDKDKLWETYLNSFPKGTNNIYRERTEHDCSCCRHFIKSIGNVILISNGEMKTIWDFQTESGYQPVIDALSNFVKQSVKEGNLINLYVTKDSKFGCDRNYEYSHDRNLVKEWTHFYLELPSVFVTNSSKSCEEIAGYARNFKEVFKSSLDQISHESVCLVLELIESNSLYRGEENKKTLTEFLKFKTEYDKLTGIKKEFYVLENIMYKVKESVGRIKNSSIGTLLLDITNEVDLDCAVRKYEAIVAPTNYKRPNAIFSKKMLEEARKTICELGYEKSLHRRFARLDDINVNNILFVNKDSAKSPLHVDFFDALENEIAVTANKIHNVEEIGIEDFVKNVIPVANEIELLLENKHVKNMVSLIAPMHNDSKSILKWENGFSWSYTGNIADSDIKNNVKLAGGNTSGDLRFSIQWNECGTDNSDLDAHCKEPSGNEIYYGAKISMLTGGSLDVDIVSPNGEVAVENIVWKSKKMMKKGTYDLYVHQYSGRTKNGFRAEIEMEGKVYNFDYSMPVENGARINVARVVLGRDGSMTLKQLLDGKTSVKQSTVWNVKTQTFVPVSTIMNSPNYWEKDNEVGNKHYLFMLKDCKNDENVNGFYNEFIKNDLLKHKRVFEALGSKASVQYADEQLSGVGFSSTQRNDVIVKVKGETQRILKIKF